MLTTYKKLYSTRSYRQLLDDIGYAGNEEEKVRELAADLETDIISDIPRSSDIQDAEDAGETKELHL